MSPNTMDLLWENGLIYDSSMRGHDLPYRLKKPNSQMEDGLVIVPSYYETDDFHLFADYPGVAPYHGRMLSPQTGYEIWTMAFDGFYKFGLCYTTMFHPQIIGKPGNIMLLDRLLTYIKKFPGCGLPRRRDRPVLDEQEVLNRRGTGGRKAQIPIPKFQNNFQTPIFH